MIWCAYDLVLRTCVLAMLKADDYINGETYAANICAEFDAEMEFPDTVLEICL